MFSAVSREVNEAVLPRPARRSADAGGRAARAGVLLGRRAAHRGGAKETASLRRFRHRAPAHPPAGRCTAGGTTRFTATPSSEDLVWSPDHLGEPCDAAITYIDHREHRMLGPEDLLGVRATTPHRARSLTPAAAIGVPRRGARHARTTIESLEPCNAPDLRGSG